MSRHNAIVPEFGPLSGVRVVSAGSIIAMPHAANMLADFGAEMIHIERPKVGDTYRGLAPFAQNGDKKISTSWAQDARNRLSVSMDINMKDPKLAQAFTALIQESDIFMENLVWLNKYGLTDEMLLKINPKLVIVHVSGFGRPEFGGKPDVCDRASYDMIGQAYSGYLFLNGDRNGPPMRANPWANDYLSGMFAVFAALTGYIHAQKTGQGQVIDVAQFESAARSLSDTFVSWTQANVLRGRTGTNAEAFQPYGLYLDKNNKYVVIGTFGASVYGRCLTAMGLDPQYYSFKDCSSSVAAVSSPKGQELSGKIKAWAAAHTGDEITEILGSAKVGVSKVYTAQDALEDEHWNLRNNFIEYEDQTLQKKITAFGIVPKFSKSPGQVWRGAPTLGQDTDAVLKKICNLSDEQIDALRKTGLI